MAKPVLVFTAPGCDGCKQVKKFLQEKSIPFKEVDITQDEETKLKLVQMGFKGTPVTIVGDKALAGFDPAQLERLLAA